ncbi:MAG: TetR/AcrR family transcriptional regulator [Acidobacteriota bacterium]
MSAIIVDKEKKREAIIKAALEVFGEKGFSRTTINDIAERAGIGKGTIYEYFRDKNEIINNSFLYFQRIFEFDIQEILLSGENGFSKLKYIVKAIVKVLNGQYSKKLDLMFDFWAEGIKGDSKNIIQKEMKKFYRSYRSLFEDVLVEGAKDLSIRNDLDPGSVSSILIGMLDGLMVQWILDKEEIKVKKIEENMIDLISKGIKN